MTHDTDPLSLRPRGGIDLGGTKIQAVVVDPDHRVLGESRRATPVGGGVDAIVSALAATIDAAARAANVEHSQLAGIGVGTPGAVNAASGVVSSAKNLSGFDGDVPLARLLAAKTGVAVHLGNDVGVALDAESALGAGRDLKSFLGVWWGTGVGGGVVIDGKRWLGRGSAGEIGHVVVKLDGALCPCGRRGCVEAYAGRRAMERTARKRHARGAKTKLFRIMEQKGRAQLASGVIAKALEREDPLATKLVDRAVRALAAGIASCVNLLDVEGVVIGGGLGTRLGEPYAQRIARAMQPHLFVPSRPPLVRVASLGDLSGAIGASLLVEPRCAAQVDVTPARSRLP